MTETTRKIPERAERSEPSASHARAFLFAGGGTGGHVIPALAVARELQKRGHSAFFVGTERGLESTLVPRAGFPLELIQIGGLKRVGLRQRVATLMQLPVSTLYAGRLMKDRRVAAVFSMGGYVAGPPVIAALVRRVPIVVMEPNAVPGLHQSAHRQVCAPRAHQFPRDGPLLPARPDRTHWLAGARGVFLDPSEGRAAVGSRC
jgi:UDP-N-acetylglucosamine--N-acetylmuramyl-(pentapeptide) pyrophosphoryl-undecaprenol N-acetylglucosamine transferase